MLKDYFQLSKKWNESIDCDLFSTKKKIPTKSSVKKTDKMQRSREAYKLTVEYK